MNILIDASGIENSIQWSKQQKMSHNGLRINTHSQKYHKDNFEGDNLHLINKLSIYLESNCIAWFTASTFFTALAVVLQP